MSSDKDLKTQYLELEQPQRRDEIVRLVERIQTDQRNAVISTAALWSYYFTHLKMIKENAVSVLAFWLPLIVVVFLIIRYFSYCRSVNRVALYMKKVEGEFLSASGENTNLGWETFLKVKLGTRGHDIVYTSLLFWGLMFLLNLLLALYMTFWN